MVDFEQTEQVLEAYLSTEKMDSVVNIGCMYNVIKPFEFELLLVLNNYYCEMLLRQVPRMSHDSLVVSDFLK